MKSAKNISHPPGAETSLATRLLHAFLVKSFLEIAVVCVAVSVAAYWYFNPQLRGAIDVADEQRVAGWAIDSRRPGESIEVQLFIDERFAGERLANEPRDDLVRARVTASSHHGFSFSLDSLKLTSGRHAVQVYALRSTTEGNRIMLPLAKYPLTFQVR